MKKALIIFAVAGSLLWFCLLNGRRMMAAGQS
jgi:hypothetical protein